jgi:asparagine synthase (glutamine-hydrolysing)
MCGIAGIFDRRFAGSGAEAAQIVSTMSQQLRHRGPDNDGIWIDEGAGMALGHRRLAIVDLSADGRQPMISSNGRYVITFNGEIYNFAALRAELVQAGASFRGHSDTEVLLTLIERFGVNAALSRAVGMFAFALFDRIERKLHLVRDRLGKKPLYFGWVGESFVFASELKAIVRHPDFEPEVDRDALAAYFRYLYVPAPSSIWRGIYKLPPGATISIDVDRERDRSVSLPEMILSYWDAKKVAEEGAAAPLTLSPDEVVDQVEETLSVAVAERMMADVPIGAFLSGGIDSSVVVALMQRHASQPVKTFSIGFEEAFYDEAEPARNVASHLGTEHHEFQVGPADTLAVVPSLAEMFDEPFADPSAVPTFLVAKLARTDVTVCLSGDGGDEVFSGYGRYTLADNLGATLDRFPGWMRSTVSSGIKGLPAPVWDAALRALPRTSIAGLRGGYSGHRLHKFADLLASSDRDQLYRSIRSATDNPSAWVRGGSEPMSSFRWSAPPLKLDHPIQRMMYEDTVTYLPDDILVKVDRASMAVSLEARAPLLDHRLVELAWRIPIQTLRLDGKGKWPLRRLFGRFLPAEWAERTKQGFGMPISEWLRGPLRDWAEGLLDPKRLEQEGFLQPQPIAKLWQEHLSGHRDHGPQIWAIVTFQAWQETWLPAGAARQLAECEAA